MTQNNKPICTSLLDSDSYKLSMGQYFHRWPNLKGHWRYINRNPGHGLYGDRVYRALCQQVEMMADIKMTDEEYNFLQTDMPWLSRNYIQWLRNYRYDPNSVKINQMKDGSIELDIWGHIYEETYWEVPLLYTISRLKYTGLLGDHDLRSPDWKDIIRQKGELMAGGGVSWIDFGARRRYDLEIEDAVCELHKDHSPLFRGTSNPMLAMKHGLKVFGTYAHEAVQVMQALYGCRMADRMMLEHWTQEFRGDLGLALTDTFTTDVFLRSFDSYYAKLFDGVRHDSNNPYDFTKKIIKHYESLGIDPTSKVVCYSDSLNPNLAISLSAQFKNDIKITCGIGTNLTHDVGVDLPPMNHVLKLIEVDIGDGQGYRGVVKLSDVTGKNTGTEEDINRCKAELGL